MPNRQPDALGIFVPRMASRFGPAMDSYHCFKLVNADTKSQVVSNTVEFRHSYLSVPAPSTEDKIIHGLQVVASALTGASPPTSIFQVEAITNLRDIFESWRLLAPPSFQPPRIAMPGCPRVPTQEPPRVVTPSPPTPARPIVSSPSWSPPPRLSGSTFLSTSPVHAPFQASPRRLNFTGPPSPRVGVIGHGIGGKYIPIMARLAEARRWSKQRQTCLSSPDLTAIHNE